MTSLKYEKELGYITTHPNYEGEGHCKDLLKTFFSKISSQSIFATTRKPAMVHILSKFGFQQTGNIYNKNLILLTYNGKK
jgi:predicted acetyltransferase